MERQKWGKLVSDFMLRSDNIQLALHFIDSRHKPTELDINLNELLNSTELPFIVLLSKADKLKQSDYNTSILKLL